MVLFKIEFEKRVNDSIAVIYELQTMKAIKPTHTKVKWYGLEETKDYLIVCGNSEYRKDAFEEIKCTYKNLKS